MNNTFLVGDKVQVLNIPDVKYNKHLLGETGTVVFLYDVEGYLYVNFGDNIDFAFKP